MSSWPKNGWASSTRVTESSKLAMMALQVGEQERVTALAEPLNTVSADRHAPLKSDGPVRASPASRAVEPVLAAKQVRRLLGARVRDGLLAHRDGGGHVRPPAG